MTDTTATLHANVYSSVQGDTEYWFRYGPTTAYGSETTHRTVFIDDGDPHPVSEPLTGLTPDTTYHWQVCVRDEEEQPPRTVCSEDRAFTTGQSAGNGPGGPILVVASAADPYSRYYAEILRAEGLNEFAVANGPVTAAMLSGKAVAILGSRPLSDAEVATLTSWVQGGGNLIAMRPDKKLAGLLGLADAGGTRTNEYMRVDTGTPAGAGIEGQSLQFHGTADRYTLAGAGFVARLYSDASTATSNPAVSLRTVGTSGGQAAAFTYDLARSVVYTRQGNPAWAGQKRDGTPNGIRANDLFYPDWIDMSKVDVPQADEQQRLLANLITQTALDRIPLPRFWYLPRGERAVVVMTGDDHAVNGTPAYFNRFKATSPPGCSVADWECVRATSYLYPGTAMSDAQAAAFQSDGFEVALHLNTGCSDFTAESLESSLVIQLDGFEDTWPSANRPVSNRTHCVVWSDWATEPKVEHAYGIRFDTNYYYLGPPGWLTQPGLLSGSGFPQRFADVDGSLIDVYQAMTQVTDESDLPVAEQMDTLLDDALGSKAWYGVFTANMHADFGDQVNANNLVASAQERGVPVVSSAQMLEWLDGRNRSSFGNLAYSGGQLDFSVAANAAARGLEAMLPAATAAGPLTRLTRDGQHVSRRARTVKGVDYLVFEAAAGGYEATYGSDSSPPVISGVSATADGDGHAAVRWDTDEPSSSEVRYGGTTALGSQVSDSARVTEHRLELTGLSPNTTYFFRAGSTDAVGNGAESPTATFQTPPGGLVDTRTAEFAAGSETDVHVGATSDGLDGEVQLRPTVGEEFESPSLPPAWETLAWFPGGEAGTAAGALAVDGSVAHTSELYDGPRVLEFSAVLEPVNDQGVGFGQTLSDFPGAAFTTGGAGQPIQLYAWSGANAAGETLTPLPGVSLHRTHRFRIVWNPSSVAFHVDGALVATHNVTIGSQMRPVASDFRAFGAGVRVHWLRQGTYATAGSHVSRVLDSGTVGTQWQALTATRTLPSGTTIAFDTRSGPTPQPDGSWSAWEQVGAGGAIASPAGRYIQYRARMTSSGGTATPTLERVSVGLNGGD
ncbi:MAG TPA: fibronectin type III domain-containing protein [Thermoleophilaceae bacterium]|nr:fibronectin type III domain-containing protein [Thermoleophilaceae bacterium]